MTTRSLPAPRRLAFHRALLLLLAAVLFALGWTAGIVVRGMLWTVAALRVGWRDAMRAG